MDEGPCLSSICPLIPQESTLGMDRDLCKTGVLFLVCVENCQKVNLGFGGCIKSYLLCVGVGSQTSSSSFQVQKLDEVEAVFVEVEADPPPVSSFPLHH